MEEAERKTELQAIKQANPIEDVARDLGLAVVAHKIRCPMPGRHTHGDRTPSVTLWPERGSFRCWVCPDVKGDVIDLVRLIQGNGFREALRWLRERSGQNPGSFPSSPSDPSPKPNPRQGLPLKSPAAMASPQAKPTHQPDQRSGPEEIDLFAAAPSPPVEPIEPAPPDRGEVLKVLLEISAPISGLAAAYLQKRRVFKRTWESQGLRWIDDYGRISRALADRFGLPALTQLGFFNAEGHFRYYRHILLFPYFDAGGNPVYLQARALQATVTPKELSLSGPIPLPYNVGVLKSDKPHVNLCEGVIDTLTLLEQGMPALGVPGAANFKPAWVPLFKGKSVQVVFDPDAAGEAGAHRVIALLRDAGIAAHRLQLPSGMDINEWLRRGGLAPF